MKTLKNKLNLTEKKGKLPEETPIVPEVPEEFPEEYPLFPEGGDDGDDDDGEDYIDGLSNLKDDDYSPTKGSGYSRGLYDRYR